MMAPLANSSAHSLKELLSNFTAESVVHDIFISGLSIDSRNIEAGYLFVAVKGSSQDGHKYLLLNDIYRIRCIHL